MTSTFFRAEWGSRAYGTNTATSDRDIIQVLIEPPPYITGLEDYRPKHESTSGTNNRSYADDTDTVTYGLKKYAELVVQGNPQVLATLWLDYLYEDSDAYLTLRTLRENFISKGAGRRYLGYMKSQRTHLTNDGKASRPRPELVEQFGYDTKFAMHAVRLGFQGLELMSFGRIQLPMSGEPLQICQDIRAGLRSKQQDIDLIMDLERLLESQIESSDLPPTGDRTIMNAFLHDTYTSEWEKNYNA